MLKGSDIIFFHFFYLMITILNLNLMYLYVFQFKLSKWSIIIIKFENLSLLLQSNELKNVYKQ